MNTGRMSERQRLVLGIAAVALILATLFFVPWRITHSDEIKWAPLYRRPISYTTSYATEPPSSILSYDEAEIALGIYLLEILAIGVVGGAAFVLSSDGTKD